MKKKNYIHVPGGSPRNKKETGPNNYSCPSPLPKNNGMLSDANNGKTADKPGAEKGGLLYNP